MKAFNQHMKIEPTLYYDEGWKPIIRKEDDPKLNFAKIRTIPPKDELPFNPVITEPLKISLR